MVAPCRHCGKTYKTREPGNPVPAAWLSTAERWQDVCNEQQDFCPCRATKWTQAAKPSQLSLF